MKASSSCRSEADTLIVAQMYKRADVPNKILSCWSGYSQVEAGQARTTCSVVPAVVQIEGGRPPQIRRCCGAVNKKLRIGRIYLLET